MSYLYITIIIITGDVGVHFNLPFFFGILCLNIHLPLTQCSQMDGNLLCTICQHDCENETCRKPDSFLLSSLQFLLIHF